jgi:hypothetical protein
MMPTGGERPTHCIANVTAVLAALHTLFGMAGRYVGPSGFIWCRALPVVLLACTLEGCGAAPSFSLVGAYFPVWLASALIGGLAALIARQVFVATGLSTELPFQLFVCAAIAILVGILVWLFWVGG